MRRAFLAVVAVLGAFVLVNVLAVSPALGAPVWSEDWDTYPTDASVQGLGGWKGWDDDPLGAAYTSDDQARSLPNSVVISGTADLVHEFALVDGVWTLTAWQYVPLGYAGTGYFILMGEYADGGGYQWACQVEFDGAADVVRDSLASTSSLPLVEGRWVEIRVQIDLDTDWQRFYYDGQLLYQYAWSAWSGGLAIDLEAIDLFANSSSLVYYDDLSLESVQQPKINEFSTDTVGTDVEYLEFIGTPNTDYSAYTLLEIEGDAGATGLAGTLDEVVNLGVTDENGFYLRDLAANSLENGTVTLLLVRGFTGALNVDYDSDNDGVFEAAPWDEVVDAVAVDDGGTGDRTYGAPVLTAFYDGLSLRPGGASRIPDGVDTDATADWVRNDFDLAGIPGYTGTIGLGEAYNTPGASNAAYTPPNTAPTISDVTDKITNEDVATGVIDFTVGDAETPATSLDVSVGSSNSTLVPGANIALGGSGTDRTVTITPALDQSGSTTVTLTVTDGGGLTATDSFVVTVNPVNDAPGFAKGANQTVAEDAGAQSVAAWATAISAGPVDESAQAVEFIVTNDNELLFSAQPAVSAAGALTYTSAPNANGSAQVSVRIRDDGGIANGGVDTSAIQTFTITVTDVNDTPVLTDVPAGATIPEMVLYSFDAGATDPDLPAQTLAFSLVDAPTGAVIDPATGVFTWTPAEVQGPGSYSFKVRVSDGAVDTDASVTLTVSDVNLAPTDLALSNQTVKENQALGTMVGRFQTTDADLPAQTFTYTLVAGAGSTDNASFTIVGDVLGTAASFNYEAKDAYTVRVRSTDSGGLFIERVFAITIKNVNEPFLDTERFQLTYTSGVGGRIQGEAAQSVRIGQDGSLVTALPDAGYRFVGWSDGFTDATRADTEVDADLAVEAEFEVIPGDRWTDISNVQWLALYGLRADQIATVADGRPDGSFGPNLAINRGQFAKMAVSAFGISTLLPATPSFTDVPGGHLFFAWIEAGKAARILTGYTDGTYRPSSTISRQQGSSILGRYLAAAELSDAGYLQGASGTYLSLDAWFAAEGAAVLAGFTDASRLAVVHAPYTAYLISRGVIMGSGGMLNPLANLTRAQSAAMVYRAAN